MGNSYIGTIRNGKVEFEQPVTLPEGSQVRVTLSPALDERAARARANVWLARHVGDAVSAAGGQLIEQEGEPVWQFQAMLTSARFAPVGPIGQVEVHAESGAILSPITIVEAMMERGKQLAPAP